MFFVWTPFDEQRKHFLLCCKNLAIFEAKKHTHRLSWQPLVCIQWKSQHCHKKDWLNFFREKINKQQKNIYSNVAECLLAKARSKDYKCRLYPDFEACGQLGQILIRPWAPLPFCNAFLQKELVLILIIKKINILCYKILIWKNFLETTIEC